MITNLAEGVQAFTSNVFLVEGERPALVDVGNDFDVVTRVRDRVPDLGVVLLTHTHPDHVGTLGDVRDAFDAPVVAFDESVPGVDRAIEDGETIVLGDHEYVTLHTPGHKDDHCCFYAADPAVLFAGDLVFAGGSFGRTDLEEGDRPTLVRSIDRVLETVDEDRVERHTGHGPSVTDRPYEHAQMAAQADRL
jgi:glyoxylase-like metal-dependent hydrolase (beta-lactamase superfamily II)